MEMENTLHEKSDGQEVFNELGNVKPCTIIWNLTDSNVIDHHLLSSDNSTDFLISFTDQSNKK